MFHEQSKSQIGSLRKSLFYLGVEAGATVVASALRRGALAALDGRRLGGGRGRWPNNTRMTYASAVEPGQEPGASGEASSTRSARRIAANSAQTSPGSTRSPGCWKWTLNPRSFSTSMSRSASRIVRLRASSQRCSLARRSDCSGSGGSAGSVLSRHPSSSNVTYRLSATPSRKRSNASDRRAFSCSTAASGATGNPVRAQNASRTCSHCAVGRKEGLEAAEVLRALDGEVAGLDLVADLEEQRALPTAAVRLAVVTDERLQRRWGEVDRHIGRQAAAPRRAVFAVGPVVSQELLQ